MTPRYLTLLSAFALLAGTPPLRAQTKPEQAERPPVPAGVQPERLTTEPAEEAILLSPFTVDAASDDGYTSAFSTSGSRLRTDLKDIAASVSVLTETFLDDVGANDIASALAYVSGAENDSTYHQENLTFSGANNYVGGDFGDNNNRAGEVRVRGLGRATTTINFIEVLGSTDRYNTDRSEFLRGANSILFGLAEPAGLINSSTKVARTSRNRTVVETKFDDLGSSRFVVDHNQVLIPKRLAMRAVGLYNDQRYEVDTAFLRDKRLFLTGTYTPFSGTTLRAYYEAQNAYGRRPNFRTVQDNVSDWLKAYNTYAPLMTPSQIASAFYWDPGVRSGTGAAPATSFTLSDGRAVNLGLIRRDLDSTVQGINLLYSPGQWIDPVDNRAVVLSTRGNTGAGTLVSPSARFQRSASSLENTVGFLDPQVTNPGIFPFETVEIGALPGNYRAERDHKVHVNLEQRITPDLFVSAAIQRETWAAEQYFATITQTNQISIDINTRMPDGRANPNFLRPFIYGRNIGENIDAQLDSLVVQANYDFDFATKTRSLGWLGFHRLTAVHTRSEQDRIRYQFNYQYGDDIPGVLPQSIAGNSQARWAMQLWYVGDPVQVGDTSLRFTGFPSTLAAHQNRSYSYQYFNAANGTWPISPTPVSTSRHVLVNGRTYTVNKNAGTGVSLQSFFWDRKIVTLLGWRTDKIDNLQRSLRTTAVVDPFPTLLGKSRDDYLGTGSRFEYEDQTSTQSIVYKPTSWLRAFANASENFAASSQRQDNLYRPVPPQSGETFDYGIGLSLMQNRLDLRLTRFTSSQNNASTAVFGQVPNNRIIAFENRLYDAISNLGRLSEWQAIGEFGKITNDRYVTPNATAATESRESTGTSLEVSFRPSPKWDFVFSVDQIDNQIISVGSELADYFAARAPFYKKWFDLAPLTNGTRTAAQDFAAGVGAEYSAGTAFIGTSNRGLSEYTSTLVARYKFLGGRLNGLNVGANLRWESGKIIGYRLKPASLNFGGLENYPGQTYDVDAPFMGDAQLTGGMQASYRRKVYSGRVMWRVQIAALNLFSETGLRQIGANSDGSPVWGIAPARAFQITNAFEF